MIKKITSGNSIIIAILVVAFLIRFIGLIPGHHPNHPDEPMSYSSAFQMLINGNLDPKRFDYPSGVPFMHALFYKTFILPFISIPVFISHPSSLVTAIVNNKLFLSEFKWDIFGKSLLNALFWSRYLTAFLAVISIFLVYKIGSKLFNKTAGIFSAFFLTFNYRHVLSSHLALSDIPNSFFALLAFYASVLLLEKNTKKHYLFCGLLVALSFSIKYQIFTLFPFVLVHLIWVFRKKSVGEFFNPFFLFSLMLIPIVFVILNPYLLLNLSKALPIIKGVSMRYGTGANKFNFYPIYYLYYWGIGELPLAAIMLGFISAMIRFPLKILLVSSFVLPFLYVFLYYMGGGTYIRNFTTVIPFLTLFAGLLFYFIWDFFHKLIKQRVLLLSMAFLFLVLINWDQIRNSITVSVYYSKPWNRELLRVWADNYLPENTQIRDANVGLAAVPNKKVKIIPWEHKDLNSIVELQEAKDDFAVLNIQWYYIYLFYWFGTPYQELLKNQGIPYDMLQNSYYGLALSEFKDYAVWESYKPWQTPDYGYLVVKIPEKLKSIGQLIKKYNFEKNQEGFSGEVWWDNQISFEDKGSLKITDKSIRNRGDRITSGFIPVIPGKTYTVEAYVKSLNKIESENKDLFVRLDFYHDNDNLSIQNIGIKQAVSGRIFDAQIWKKLRVFATAPDNVKYLTISFEREKIWKAYTYWIDDISIFESTTKPEEKFKNIPYNKSIVPDDVLYPNSIY